MYKGLKEVNLILLLTILNLFNFRIFKLLISNIIQENKINYIKHIELVINKKFLKKAKN